MPTNVVPKCMQVISGCEDDFLSHFLGCTVPDGRDDECAVLVEAFATAYPNEFLKAVGAYIHNMGEVA